MSQIVPNEDNGEATRELAKKYNAEVWRIFETPNSNPQDLERMIHAAHASYMLWQDVGSPVNEQRGLWVLSRAYAEIGDGAKALHFAGRCRVISDEYEEELRDFDKAYVLEAQARSNAISGNLNEANEFYALAMAEGQDIARPEDREIFEKDLSAGNWGSFKFD